MCGVSFYYSLTDTYTDQLLSSLQITAHRGPDSTNIYTASGSFGNIGLGHNRLSIIDVSDLGMQPMTRGGVTISFNGEIYNFRELRTELVSKGRSFVSGTDTEVIIQSYLEFGIECFARLRGMFCFVILDQPKGLLFVVRDRLGIKPIYLYKDVNSIFGCSEIKGLKKYLDLQPQISADDVFEFFNTGFLYEPATGYVGIEKLMPGNFLKVDLSCGEREIVRYADVNVLNSDLELTSTLVAAVASQQVADVPLGLFFSGGADSSILAALSTSSDLLFAKYDADPNSDFDFKYSSDISRYLKRDLITTDIVSDKSEASDILESFDFVAKHSEELISDYTLWSTYLLSKAARNKGYKVMLSGMGGDEIFAGYPRYLVLKWHRALRLLTPVLLVMNMFKLFPERLSKKFDRLVSYCSESTWPMAYSRLIGYFSASELGKLFNGFDELDRKYRNKLNSIALRYHGDSSDKIKLAQHFDITGFLAHNLMVSDKASMLASIELRVPLLDEDVVAYGLASNSRKLVVGRQLKAPLRNLLKTLIPRHLVNRPKTGFNPPLDGLINKLGPEIIRRELDELSTVFNPSLITSLIDDHFSQRSNNTYKIWQLLYFVRCLRYSGA